MNTIYLIIRKIGDFEEVVDKAYWYWESANKRANEIQKEEHQKGYVDFRWFVREIEIEGLK